MAISAYVIIECEVDPAEVVLGLRQLPGVRQAHALFGPMDAIAYIEGEALADLEQVVTSFYTVQGVSGTDTRICRV